MQVAAAGSCTARRVLEQIGAQLMSAFQFRDGGKFCVHKRLVKTKLNKKLKSLALKSSLAD